MVVRRGVGGYNGEGLADLIDTNIVIFGSKLVIARGVTI